MKAGAEEPGMQPAEPDLMEFSTHTRTGPRPVCHLLDAGSLTATKHDTHNNMEPPPPPPSHALRYQILSSVPTLLSLPLSLFFAQGCRTQAFQEHEEELVNVGQLLHRFLSRARSVSLHALRLAEQRRCVLWLQGCRR